MLPAGIPPRMFWPYPPPPGTLCINQPRFKFQWVTLYHLYLPAMCPDTSFRGGLCVLGQGVVPGKVFGGMITAMNVMML